VDSTKQTNVTLYTVIGDFSRIKKSLISHFSNSTKEVENLLSNEPGVENFAICFDDDTKVYVYIYSDKGFIETHISGMYNFFAQVDCENHELKQNILHQISVFNCMTSIVFTLVDDKRTDYVMSTVLAVAEDINALMLTPNMRLFSSDRKLIFSADGDSDLLEYTPIANTDVLDGSEELDSNDISRLERSITVLREKGIPYIPDLPTAVPEAEAVIRSPKEIAERLVTMFSVCVYCEARGSDESWEKSQRYLSKGDKILGGRMNALLTPEETLFIGTRTPDSKMLAKFSWRYECCHVLMWALGFSDSLGDPNKVCNVSSMATYLSNQKSLEMLIRNAKPRGKNEILDLADLTMRYNWACVDARLNKKSYPPGLSGGVVYEWHYTFNWLIGYNNADWDNVLTHT